MSFYFKCIFLTFILALGFNYVAEMYWLNMSSIKNIEKMILALSMFEGWWLGTITYLIFNKKK